MQALRPGAATALDAATLEAIAGDVPSAALDRDQVVDQLLVQVMVATGLQPNKSASKRMIKVGTTQNRAAVHSICSWDVFLSASLSSCVQAHCFVIMAIVHGLGTRRNKTCF